MESVRTLAVVDRNEAIRAGIAALAAESPSLEYRCGIAHDDVDAHAGELAEADVVLVAGHDESRLDDHFPSPRAVSAIRRAVSRHRHPPLVIAYSEHWRLPALRLRLCEAQANAIVPLGDIGMSEGLRAIADWRPEEYTIPPVRDVNLLRSLGVTSRSRVNDYVDRVIALGIATAMCGDSAEALGSRRRVRNVRNELSQIGRIDPVNTDGVAPRRGQDTPSVRQLQRLYRWATRVDPEDFPDLMVPLP